MCGCCGPVYVPKEQRKEQQGKEQTQAESQVSKPAPVSAQ